MKQTHGWSLLELTTVLSILALLLVSAGTSLNHSMQASNSQHASAQTFKAIAFARQQATSKSSRITLCGINTKKDQPVTLCQKTEINAWVIFDDQNDNHQPDISGAKQEVIRITPASQDKNYWQLKMSFGKNYLRFTPEGNAMESGSIIYCPSSGKTSLMQVLKINYTGRVYNHEDEDLSNYEGLC